MKVIGIVGSYRKSGNTDLAVRKVLEGLESQNVTTACLYLNDFDFQDCIGCEGCKENFQCVIQDDMQMIYPLLMDADGIVVGSPTYFNDITSKLRSFLNRLYCYQIFSPLSREIMTSVNHVFGRKPSITLTVGENPGYADINFAALNMNKTLETLGYQIVESLEIFDVFQKGSIREKPEDLELAYEGGIKLAQTINLQDHIQKTFVPPEIIF